MPKSLSQEVTTDGSAFGEEVHLTIHIITLVRHTRRTVLSGRYLYPSLSGTVHIFSESTCTHRTCTGPGPLLPFPWLLFCCCVQQWLPSDCPFFAPRLPSRSRR